MQPKPKSLTTAADDLLDIVKTEKEISFADAARKLNVSPHTIEAWATFLEEDGILSVKYKMTTPYLTLPAARKAAKKEKSMDALFQDKLADAEIKTEIENVSGLLTSAESKRAEGDFGVLDSIFSQVLSKLKKIMQFVSSRAYVSPQKKAGILKKYAEAEEKTKMASELLKENKFDEANSAYSGLQSELKGIVQETKNDYLEEEDIKVSREAGLKKILDKTYELLEKGKLEEAASNYEKTKEIFASFSQQWQSEKSSMQESIIKLNRDIVVYSNKIKRQRMEEGAAKINKLVALSRENLQKRKFPMAAAYYGEVKKNFDSLPAGFAREKRRLKEEILKVFEQLIQEKEKRLQYRFGMMSKEIESLLREAEKQLEAGNSGEAFRTYRLLGKTYSQLPHGFLKEKLGLQNRIMPLYSRLSQTLERKAETELSVEASQILRLLGAMKQQISAGNFSEANQTYSEINRAFGKMPEGFVQQKTELQKRIVELYEKLLENVDAKKSLVFKSSVEEINRLIGECQDGIKKRDYAGANAIYRKLKEAYTKLSPHDIARRQQIRNSILTLYRSIIIGEQPVPAEKPQNSRMEDIHQKIEALKSRSKAQVRMPA